MLLSQREKLNTCQNRPSHTKVPQPRSHSKQMKTNQSTWRMQAATKARHSLKVQKLSNNLGAVQRKKLGKFDAAYEVHQVLCCILVMHLCLLVLHPNACTNICCCLLMLISTLSAAAAPCCIAQCLLLLHHGAGSDSALWQLYVEAVISPPSLHKESKVGCDGASSLHPTGMLLHPVAAIALACMCLVSWTLLRRLCHHRLACSCPSICNCLVHMCDDGENHLLGRHCLQLAVPSCIACTHRVFT